MKSSESTLTPKQSEVAQDTHRFRVLNWGRRAGKTTLAVWEMIGKAVSGDGMNVAYFATTYAQARDIAWRELVRKLGPAAKRINESRLEVVVHTVDGGESIITLRGWENIETARGQKFDLVVLDEVASMRSFWEGWSEVLRPALADTKGAAMFISTPQGFNHFYDLYNTDAADYASFHATSYDNPNIDPAEIDQARAEMTQDRFEQEFMADFRKQEGLVFKEFLRGVHTYKEADIIPAWRMGGVDFGYVHPAAVVSVVKDKRGTYWVTDELSRSGMTDAKIAEYVASKRYERVYPDPAQPQGIKELSDRGVNCYEVVKGKDSVRNGIQKMRELFMQGRLKVHVSCKQLIHELETWCYKEGSEEPEAEGEDSIDALRYVVMMTDNERRHEDAWAYQMNERDYHNTAV